MSSSQVIFTLSAEATSGHRAYIYHLAASESQPAEGGRLRHQFILTSKRDVPVTCAMVGDKNRRWPEGSGLNESTLASAGFLLLESKPTLTTARCNGCLMQRPQI